MLSYEVEWSAQFIRLFIAGSFLCISHVDRFVTFTNSFLGMTALAYTHSSLIRVPI